MFRVVAALFFASILLSALALISCLSVEDQTRIRNLPRYLWVLLIVLVPLVGAGAWFWAGRPAPEGGTGSGWPIGGFPDRPRPKAPDDDPDFLRSLGEPPTINDEDERLLRQWEEDLRRREEEQRRRDADTEN
jgi:hypothetical protein